MTDAAINLTFHGVGKPCRELDAGEAGVWVTRTRFEQMLDAIRGRDDVRITFDDGNASDVEHALPALAERGLTASFFIVAGRIGAPGYLEACSIRRLAEAGMTVGSHGMRHRPWRSLNHRELHDEVVTAKLALEDVLERPVTEAACPFGSYDRRVLSALGYAGYHHVFTSDRGPARAGDWLQARNTLRRDDDGAALDRILAGRPRSSLRRRVELAAKRWR